MVSHGPQICLVQHVPSSWNHLPELLLVDPPFIQFTIRFESPRICILFWFPHAGSQMLCLCHSHIFPSISIKSGLPFLLSTSQVSDLLHDAESFLRIPWAPQWPIRSHGSPKLGTSSSGSSCRTTSATLLLCARCMFHYLWMFCSVSQGDALYACTLSHCHSPRKTSDSRTTSAVTQLGRVMGRCCFKCWSARQRKTPNL